MLGSYTYFQMENDDGDDDDDDDDLLFYVPFGII